jgi:hypothetical protein
MRMIFGVMSLLIVLAIVGTIGKKQLHALSQIGATTARVPADAAGRAVSGGDADGNQGGTVTVAVPGAMGGMASAEPAIVDATVPMQAQTIQKNMRDATNAALQKGADRSHNAQP